jgi:hypothetical protein
MGRHPGLLASKDTSLLLMVSASSSRSVNRNGRLLSAIEESHYCVVGGVLVRSNVLYLVVDVECCVANNVAR